MSEVHLPHQHSDEGTMRELQESVETIGSFQTVADVFKQLSDSSRVRIFWLLCHCEECVIDLSAMVGMSSPAVSHHLRQLRESGLLVSRRVGKEVYYRAAENEQAQLLHRMIERTMEISCPEEESKAATGAPHLPPLDAEVYEGGGTSEQIETIRAVHDYLTQHLDSRTTIDELSRRFLMNPSTMKALFKSVYGSSLASHIREHRMQHAARLLLEGDETYACLLTVPGIGPRTAAQLAVSVDIGRFPDHDHLASYCGIAPRVRSSGTSVRSVRASRRGDARLKSLLIFSCNSLVRSSGRYGEYYRACRARGMGHGRALKAVARKRLRAIYAVMRDRVPYRE